MSCPHCEAIRAAQRAFLAEHGQSGFGSWMHEYEDVLDRHGKPKLDKKGRPERHLVSSVRLPRWPIPDAGDEGVQLCRCDCHTIARIGGVLPRLRSAP